MIRIGQEETAALAARGECAGQSRSMREHSCILLAQPRPWPSLSGTGILALALSSCEESLLRLKTNLGRQVILSTDYSGYDCPREAMRCALQGIHAVHGWTFGEPPCKWARCCDSNELSQLILSRISLQESAGGTCLFDDILHRLPIWAREWIASAAAPKDADKESKKQANDTIREWLMKGKSSLFPADATSYCLIHEKMCPVHCMRNADDDDHDGGEHVNQVRPLRGNISGVSCLPWAGVGTSEGRPRSAKYRTAAGWLSASR